MINCCLLAGLLLASCAHDPACVERVGAFGRLWATIKYFHPWLAWRDVIWDEALVRTLPAALAARNHQDFARAVEEMLGALGDPATRVLRFATPAQAAPLTRTAANGVVIVTINPATLGQGSAAASRLRQALPAIRTARGVVFDLRNHGAWAEREPATVGLAFQASGLNQLLEFAHMKAPAQRWRIYSGLPASAPGGSAFYHGAFYVRDGAIIEPRPGAQVKPAVFLVDESSCLPPIAAALQAAGHARIVAQGGVSDASLNDSVRFELPGDLRVAVRVSELVYQDGTTGLPADVTVPANDPQAALQRAVELASDFARAPAAERLKLPPYAMPPAERSYAEPQFPGLELRLLAGFRLWAAVRYFFAYRELMEHDWDGVVRDGLARLMEAKDAQEYGLALAEMVKHLEDSHAEVSSQALQQYFGTAAPPLRTRWIEGSPVITQLADEAAARKAGISVGDVVLAVDEEPAVARIERLKRYISASTEHSRAQLIMERWLNGPPGSSVLLELRDWLGQIKHALLARSSRYVHGPWRRGPVIGILPGQIGYVDLNRLSPDEVEHMFERLRHTRAIIFDLRGYPRGTGWLIASRLTDRTAVPAAKFIRPLALLPEGRMADVYSLRASWEFLQYLPETGGWKYRGPTIALIDERTISQAEHAALFLRAANGTRFVGSPSAGADGDVTRFLLPGGVVVSFSGQQVCWPDGKQLQRLGILPDLEARPTLAGIRAGRDEVLEKALAYLGVADPHVRGVGEAR